MNTLINSSELEANTLDVEVRDERIWDVVEKDVLLEQLVSGFKFLEGPLWHPGERHLIFSDIVGDAMYRWSETDGATVFRQPSHMANGNAYDREGRLLTCEHATSRVTRTDLNGSVVVLASHYQGKELNSPNDIVAKRDGAIYFTDPLSGRSPFYGVPREPELDFQGVYRLAGDELTLLVDDFSKPNGLCFSQDETLLFINDTDRAHIRVFDVDIDGKLSNGRVWAELTGDDAGVADGMKIDSAGYLFSCGPGGIHVFADDATCLGVLRMPEHTANFAWGADDLHSLFVTASTTLYCVRMKTRGLAAFNKV